MFILLVISATSPPVDQAAFLGTNGKISFDTNRDSNEDIYVMDAEGADPTRLTNNPASDHGSVWSPDGTKIAFPSNRDGNFEIYVMNAHRSGQTNLSNRGAQLNILPDWSPDGTKIVFHTNRDGNHEVYVKMLMLVPLVTISKQLHLAGHDRNVRLLLQP